MIRRQGTFLGLKNNSVELVLDRVVRDNSMAANSQSSIYSQNRKLKKLEISIKI